MFLLSRSVEKRPIRLSLEIEAVIHTHWHSRKVGYTQIWETVKMISPMQEGESRIRRMQRRIQTGLRTQGVLHMKEPPSKIRMGPHTQRALAGNGTSKSGGGTGKAIHAILCSNLTQVLQLLVTS